MRVTIHASFLAGLRGSHSTQWRTNPLLQVQMKRLFMPCPVIFVVKRVCAECTLENAGLRIVVNFEATIS